MIHNMTGGGAGLKLKVVGGTAVPANPRENTVWVNTDSEISCYAFSATKPHRVSKNKNLNVYPYLNTTNTENGVTWTDNADGTLTANGTASEQNVSIFRCSQQGIDMYEFLLPPGTYFISGCPAGGAGERYYVTVILSYDNWASSETIRDYGLGKSFTLAKEAKARLHCSVAAGAAVSNITFRPQLEKGSAATSFVKGDATGMLWFKTGATSNAPINIDKKNTVMLYPNICQQYINGAWVSKTAKIYSSAKWSELWDGGLYVGGNQYEAITGGWWNNYNLSFKGSSTYPGNSDLNLAECLGDYISLSGKNGYFSSVTTKNKIDLSNFSTLNYDVLSGSDTDEYIVFIHDLESGTINNNSAAQAKAGPVDISSIEGSYYITVGSLNVRTVKVANLRVE